MFDLNISKDLITIYQKEGKESPLINLFNFIVEAIKKKDFALFKLLVDKYKPSLDRDSNFMEALDSMSKHYFKKPLKAQFAFAGLMRNMLDLFTCSRPFTHTSSI
eukprot:TRINITY_DN8733_c0_g3_i4.p1 TRINITY_DN8733_c0_g3~~TRINITY_DN8733_c0_g3_i4.p1  ORF type:complete len:105 (+),score=27.97 TRINITY_DN8733_c0_g3_i4:125-439(+)